MNKFSIKLPIFIKLMITFTLIISGLSIYTNQINSKFYEKIFLNKEFDYNLKHVRTVAEKVEKQLNIYLSKIRFYSLFTIQSENLSDLKNLYLSMFNQDTEIIQIEIMEKQGEEFIGLKKINRNNYIKKYNKKNNDLINQIKSSNLPYQRIFNGEVIILNISTRDALPVIWLGVPLQRDKNGNIKLISSSIITIEAFQNSVFQNDNSILYLVDERKNTLAHPNEEYVISQKYWGFKNIVSKAFRDTINSQQMRYEQNNKSYIGAYAKNKFKILTVSETLESAMQYPVAFASSQSKFILGIALSLTLLIIYFFSTTLTRPIEKLVEFSKLISKGNFDLEISKEINTSDELSDLAIALENMTEGLKERDKVKNIMSKFHGSTIAEDLYKNDLERRGTKKEVVIFFSDIRGFTSFSESKEPEEVVAMINEYMDMMVEIIYKYNGIVDKFVGDAIMAVWGVPNPSKEDAYNALLACIEMRKGLEKLNQKRIARSEEPILTGIGLHTGKVISGTVGSKDRMEYTIIGDAVNTAARIEASTKSFGTDLLISGEMKQKIATSFICNLAGKSQVKGKTNILELYKVDGIIQNGIETIIRTPYSSYEAEEDKKAKKVS